MVIPNNMQKNMSKSEEPGKLEMIGFEMIE